MTVSTTALNGAIQHQRYLISAPGKVIMFGEHAVVHQKLAVAASLGLRTYMYLERTNDGICKVDLPDVGIQRSWSFEDLLSAPVAIDDSDDKHPINNMTPETKERLVSLTGSTEREAQNQAIMAFLYLFFTFAAKQKKEETFGFTIHTRSMLPVSAGLGSSASYSSTIAAALLILFDYIPFDFAQTKCPEKKAEYLELVNRYAFKSEQVIHGNPSGVDNAVTTFGGAKTFRRGQGFETLEGFQSLRLLLTNTRVPRSTSALVAGVGAKKQRYPAIVNPILDAIDGISLRCKEAFKRHREKEIDSLELVAELEDLVNMNHCLLHALGVSHASLEQVRSATAEHGIVTKLTGAGGGGCALSIIRDSVLPETIKAVTENLEAAGFDCYQTSLGGIGVSAVLLGEKEDENWMVSTNRDTLEAYFQ